MKLNSIILLLTTIIFSGCAGNIYQSGYRGRVASAPQVARQISVIDGSMSPKADNATMEAKGYAQIGWSDYFIDGLSTGWAYDRSYQGVKKDALEQAKSVNADAVVVYYTTVGARSTNLQFVVPTTTISNTNTSGNIYGNNSQQYGSYSGRSTTVTHGTRTENVAVSATDARTFATFWIKKGKR